MQKLIFKSKIVYKNCYIEYGLFVFLQVLKALKTSVAAFGEYPLKMQRRLVSVGWYERQVYSINPLSFGCKYILMNTLANVLNKVTVFQCCFGETREKTPLGIETTTLRLPS